MRNVARWVHVPARSARYAPFPANLDPRLVEAMVTRGINQLYSHQAEAVVAGLSGEHVAVVTRRPAQDALLQPIGPERLLADPTARALYLFRQRRWHRTSWRSYIPGRNDWESGRVREWQKRQLHVLTHSPSPRLSSPLPPTTATLLPQRPKIRDSARVVLSNPDMLHAGILPQHPRWAAFFANLDAVVVDEMHVYRGVFGSHVANVLRRLRRVCRFYGSEPQFFLTSATIANPDALAERLVEAPVTVIGSERDGAPQGTKEILFYNPPLLDPGLGIRRSSSLEASDLSTHFLAHDVQTIVSPACG